MVLVYCVLIIAAAFVSSQAMYHRFRLRMMQQEQENELAMRRTEKVLTLAQQNEIRRAVVAEFELRGVSSEKLTRDEV